MRRLVVIAAAEFAAITVGWVLVGVVAAAVIAVGIMAWSLKKAKVIAVPEAEQALRADAGVLAARMERLADDLRRKAMEATSIATEIKEGR